LSAVASVRDTIGRIVITVGAISLFVALFLPWYELDLSSEDLAREGGYFLVFQLGTLDAWHVFSYTDAYLAAVAALAAATLVVSHGGRSHDSLW
jgi:hypothetical protein